MTAPLYNTEILRLAASLATVERLADPASSVERRSPVCGSRVTVDVNVDADGKVAELGMLVRACALGQAASSLMAANAIGQDTAALKRARDQLTRWLANEGPIPDWPGLEIFTPALPHTARHSSIRLAFEAVAEATDQASRNLGQRA